MNPAELTVHGQRWPRQVPEDGRIYAPADWAPYVCLTGTTLAPGQWSEEVYGGRWLVGTNERVRLWQAV